jgi:hypothetical protein
MSLVLVSPPRAEHRRDCRFGSGFYRIVLRDGTRRYCQSEGEVEWVSRLLPHESIVRIQRDGHCLDGEYGGDAHTPDVVDGAAWLALPRTDGMRELGLTSEADYIRTYRAVEDAIIERDRAEAHGGVHASVVIKRRGVRVRDV